MGPETVCVLWFYSGLPRVPAARFGKTAGWG